MRHPNHSAEGEIPAGDQFERTQWVRRMRVVRVNESDVAECADQQHTRTGCGVKAMTMRAVLTTPPRGLGSRIRFHHATGDPAGP